MLNYPVEKTPNYSNLTLSKFLEILGKDESCINSSEVIALSEIETLSLLFVLNNHIKGLKHVREYNDGVFLGQSIIVIGVDLSENESNYEYTIPAITNFFNRLINTQVLILFRRKDKICFSVKRRRINKKDETQDAKGSNFQTEWISIYPPSEESILKIIEISFDELRDENFYFMYNDLVACIASDYFIEDFPNESNISSHIKMNDGIALYIRDMKNLCYGGAIVTTELLNNDLSSEKIDDDISGSNMEVLEKILELFEDSTTQNADMDISDGRISVVNFDDELSDTIPERKYSSIDKAINVPNNKCSMLGGEIVESKKVQDIHKNLSSLIDDLEALKEYYREKRKNEPENLSLDDVQKYVNDLFDKTKAADSLKNEIIAIMDKFSTVINDFGTVINELNDFNVCPEDVEVYVNKKQSKTNEIETEQINPNKETYIKSDKEISDEIKFPLKYGSISVKAELLKTFFNAVLEFRHQSKQYFEVYDLKIRLLDYIKKNSSYKQPEHVFNNILKFLIDWEVISLYEGSKRGKYIVKDIKTLQEMINDTKMIEDLLKS